MSTKQGIQLMAFLLCIVAASSAEAAWISLTSPIQQVVTLEDRLMIYLVHPPKSTCPYNDAFGLSPEGMPSTEARRNILAVVLIAQVTGKALTVWYDDTRCDPLLQRPTTGQFHLVSD